MKIVNVKSLPSAQILHAIFGQHAFLEIQIAMQTEQWIAIQQMQAMFVLQEYAK